MKPFGLKFASKEKSFASTLFLCINWLTFPAITVKNFAKAGSDLFFKNYYALIQMKHLSPAFLCLFLYLLPQSGFSQTPNLLISYTNPDGLFVCGSDTLTINIQNSGDAMEAGALLAINLPAGLSYVAGSVTGANQQNISNLASPVYTLPAIIMNGNIQVKVVVTADCNAADWLDSGGLFFATISISGQNSNASVT